MDRCPCLLQELGVLLDEVDGGEVALQEVLGNSADAGAAVEAAVVPWGVVDAEQSFEEFGRAVDVGAGDFGEAAEHPVYRRGNVGPVLGGLLVRDPVIRFFRFHFQSGLRIQNWALGSRESKRNSRNRKN